MNLFTNPAATFLSIQGSTQATSCDLMRNKWEKFGLEMLITLEARTGRGVTLELAGTPALATENS